MKRMTVDKVPSHTFQSSLTLQGWMRTDHVADYLGTSPNNIRNMVYRGILFPRKLAGRWLFKKEEIDRLIETEGK